MKKTILSLTTGCILLTGCGGGGSSTTETSLENMNIEGEWNYVATLENCDKEEIGTLIIKKISETEFNWSVSSDNGLESDCTYDGTGFDLNGVYNASTDISINEFNNYLTSIDSTSSITGVTFNSTDKITFTSTYDGGNFTEILTRNDADFDGNSYSGLYSLTSGSSECDSSGPINLSINNSTLSGTAITTDGTITISGFVIEDGKISGTTSDGTIWGGIITTDEVYGTYTNSTYNCIGTYSATNATN